MGNQIIREMSAAEYHADHTRISKHGLDLIRRAPALLDNHRRTPAKPQTAAMRLGSLVHLAVLEPDVFRDAVTEKPDIDRRTKDGKAAYADLEARFRYIIDADELSAIRGMQEAARSVSRGLFIESKNEVTIHWERGGVACKSRLDAVKGDVVVDLKTCADASTFQRDAIKFRYHVQAAFYLDALRSCCEPAETFAFVAVEKEPPHLATVFYADDAFIDAGRIEYMRDLETYRRCLEDDLWPGLPEEQTLTLPSWYVAR